jgi:hypothetical protein
MISFTLNCDSNYYYMFKLIRIAKTWFSKTTELIEKEKTKISKF